MNRILISIIAVLCISVSALEAQELTPIIYNHAIKKHLIEKNNLKSTSKPYEFLAPPFPDTNFYFFEDFSYYNNSVYPDAELWSGTSGFVNQTYPDSCVSIGVVTLDGVDGNGDLYSFSDGSFPSDTLTSKNIDLQDKAGQIYLSFFYQGGGKGDAPEVSDTLLLDFFDADDAKWIMVWHSLGVQTTTFEQVALPIHDTLRKSNFKFRFRNWTSTDYRDSNGGDEGGVGNSDMWNIDYIQVKRVPTIDDMFKLNDLAFVYPLKPTHKLYHSLPYNHLTFSQGDRRPKSDVTIRANFPGIESGTSVTVRKTYSTSNIYKGIITPLITEGAYENDQNVEFERYTEFFTPAYNYTPTQDYGHFEYRAFVDTVTGDKYNWNDTIKKEEIFKDYYAYDDGTAEFGFGLPGNGGINMRLAYQYPLAIRRTNPADTLTAVDIHFIKTRNNASSLTEFKICVWANNDSVPGELLYPSINKEGELTGPLLFPDTTLKINEFMRIKLDQELIVKDTIYIGLVQLNTGTLGIGYDINSNSRSAIFTNDGNQWLKTIATIPSGSIMMRPVFGHYNYTGLNSPKLPRKKEELFKVYPNPVRNTLIIETLDNTRDYSKYTIEIYNLLGRCLYNNRYNTTTIDFSNYSNGLYYVRIQNNISAESYTYKIIKRD